MNCIQLVWILFLCIHPCVAVVRNITIDDTFGDGFGNFPIYQPNSAWEDANCVGCLIRPDRLIAHQGTWTAATYNPDIDPVSMTINFQGTAIYVFLILANEVAFADTETFCNFTLDGQIESTFHHVPSTSLELQYDELAFAKTGLSMETNHTVSAVISGQSQNYWIGFDYAIVTYDDSPPPSTTSTTLPTASSDAVQASSESSSVNVGAIAGGVVGGVILIAALVFAFFFYQLRKKRAPPPVDLTIEAPMTPNPRPGASVAFASSNSGSTHPNPSYLDPYPPSPASNLESLGYSKNVSRITTAAASPTIGSSSSSNSNSRSVAIGSLGYPSSSGGVSSPSTSTTSSAARRASLRDARQRELETQVAQLRQQLSAVQEGPNNNRRALEKIREAEEAEKAQLRNQVTELQGRIEQLSAAQSSPWAQGDSDDPPPGYTPVPA